jgi:hypothetical protein
VKRAAAQLVGNLAEVVTNPQQEYLMMSTKQPLIILRNEVCQYDTIGKTCATLNSTTSTWHHRR